MACVLWAFSAGEAVGVASYVNRAYLPLLLTGVLRQGFLHGLPRRQPLSYQRKNGLAQSWISIALSGHGAYPRLSVGYKCTYCDEFRGNSHTYVDAVCGYDRKCHEVGIIPK